MTKKEGAPNVFDDRHLLFGIFWNVGKSDRSGDNQSQLGECEYDRIFPAKGQYFGTGDH
jgi:hypothetical protein